MEVRTYDPDFHKMYLIQGRESQIVKDESQKSAFPVRPIVSVDGR